MSISFGRVPDVVLRRLAHSGELAKAAVLVPETSVVELRRAAYEVAWPIVYDRHTRKLESGKGHHHCASSIKTMEQSCIDRFHDDVETVIDHLLARADSPIHNLEGWITSCLLVTLASRIIEWVGVPTSAGAGGWQPWPWRPGWTAARTHTR